MPPTFTPQPVIASRRDLGRALLSQALNQPANSSSLAPAASLVQGLAGGFLGGSANRFEANNEVARKLTSDEAAIAARDGRSIGEVLMRGPDPKQREQGLALLGQEAERASTSKFRDAQLQLQRDRLALEKQKSGQGSFAVDPTTGRVFNKRTGEIVEGTGKSLAEQERTKAEARARGQQIGKLRSEVTNQGRQASSRLTQLRRLKQLNKQATTGFLADTRLTAGRFLRAVGMDPGTLGINPNLPASEAINSLSKMEALQLTQQTKGAISNREMEMFLGATPGLSNTQEGNAAMLAFFETAAKRSLEIAKRSARLGVGEFDEATLDDIATQVRAEIPMPPIPGATLKQRTEAPATQRPGAPRASDTPTANTVPKPRFVPGTVIENSQIQTLPEGATVRDPATGQFFQIRNGQPVPLRAPGNAQPAGAGQQPNLAIAPERLSDRQF